MCGAQVSSTVPACAACGESLLPFQPPRNPRAKRLEWRELGGILAAALMFLVGVGMLVWFAWRCFAVVVFGGSIAELGAILAATLLPFLLGWEFLFGRKGKL